ncbi:universal stress protein [Pseudonocardia sp. D17]|jgi:nucleotide-binding universal stress UspA family protein|uniref:universal stress protein n=1 Tax=Pseudonocardia sp. D17 TaxID=882661 RepID=UPI000CD2129F|nr:hypothetical protein PSD17_13830 [Pseudonocardia sp. D17]
MSTPDSSGNPSHPVVVIAREPDTVPSWVRSWTRHLGTVLHTTAANGTAAAVSAAGRALEGLVLILRATSCAGGAETPQLVVAAVQDDAWDRPVVDTAASVADLCHARLRVLHAVPRAFGERSVGLAEAVDRGRQLVGAAVARSGITATGQLVRAWPHEVLDETLEADLLVVGGPRPGSAAELGPTARAALFHAPCPVLVVPRAGR